MTLEEILKAKNLSDDDIKSVIGEMKQNKIFTSGEENLDIRYGKLKTDFDSLTNQHGESTALIEQMKKDNAGNKTLQGKITEYETNMTAMKQELEQTKTDVSLIHRTWFGILFHLRPSGFGSKGFQTTNTISGSFSYTIISP